MTKRNLDARVSMFGRLAMEAGLVTYDDVVACIEEQEQYRAEGKTAPKLGEVMVERGLITKQDVELILKMQSNPGGLIGRQLIERGLVTREQLREALDEQAELVHAGITPPKIGEMLVDKGLITADDLKKLLMKKKGNAGNLLGQFLVAHRLIKPEDLQRCLDQQKAAADKGENVPRLGDLLVANGVLRKEQVELYVQRHLQSRRQVAPPLVTGVVKPTSKSRRVLGEYEILDSLGQHVDGVTFRALHGASGAIVIMHHFNTAGDVVAVPVTAGDASAPDTAEIKGTFEHKVTNALLLRGQATQVLLADDNVNGHRALIADYIDGVTLDRVIREQTKIEWSWAAEILSDFCGILSRAAKLGIHHDDIRPGSVIVDAAGKAKLSLWCYTQDPVANRDWLAQRHRNLTFYFAPERMRSVPSERADMFSLGLTLIHAITGAAPIVGDNAKDAVSRFHPGEALQDLALDVRLPLEFLNIIGSMVEINPNNRPASFEALSNRVRDFMESEGLETGRGATAVARDMSLEQANHILDSYLSVSAIAQKAKKIRFSRMFGLFLGPLAAMVIIMLAVTTIYKLTQSSHGLMVRANWLDHQGDKPGALALYRMISSLYPTNPLIQKRYYDLAMEVRDHGEAELALEKIMNINPENMTEHLEMQADLQVWQKRFSSAAELYSRVLRTRPGDLKLRAKLASALLWGHDYADAMREYRELAALEPSDTAHLLGLARAAAGAKDYQFATDTFQKLFLMNKLPEATLMEYGWILHDQGREDELKDISRTALSRNESIDYSPRHLITLNSWSGDWAKAKAIMESIGGGSVDDRQFLLYRITLNDKLGNIGDVVQDYAKLSELEPDNINYLMTIGHLYQGEGDFEKASTAFQNALNRQPNNIEIRREIARNFSYMSNLDETIRWYQEILAIDPRDKQAMDGMIQALLWNEKYDEAQKYVESAYKSNPSDKNNRVNLALVLSRLGREDEILPIVDELIKDNRMTEEEKERIALNALASNSNRLLLRLIGATAISDEKVTELRLMLARRLRAQGQHVASLPLYAAVLASTANPTPDLIMEMAESANWAKRPDIATRWLEIAMNLVSKGKAASVDQLGSGQTGVDRDRLLLSSKDWDSLLRPLRRMPTIYESLSGFQGQFSSDGRQ